jgi:hypothetical protein
MAFDVADVVQILEIAVGLREADETQLFYADIFPCSKDGTPLKNGYLLGDGKIDINDATLALEVIIGARSQWWPDSQ